MPYVPLFRTEAREYAFYTARGVINHFLKTIHKKIMLEEPEVGIGYRSYMYQMPFSSGTRLAILSAPIIDEESEPLWIKTAV